MVKVEANVITAEDQTARSMRSTGEIVGEGPTTPNVIQLPQRRRA
jgi:hypothetical protein